MLFKTFLNTLVLRIRKNRNAIITIMGETGSGKTYCALRLGELLDKEFCLYNISFTAADFIKKINDHFNGSHPLKKGTVLIVDEAGVEFSNRRWQSNENQLLGMLAQSFRSLNWIVIFTLPHLSFFEKQARMMSNYVLCTSRIDYKNKTVQLELWEMKLNRSPYAEKPYMPVHPTVRNPGHEETQRQYINLGLPSQQLRDSFEALKYEWQKVKYKELSERLNDGNGVVETPSNDINVFSGLFK